MDYICQFVGGKYNGRVVPLKLAEQATQARSRSWAKERAAGSLVPRAELDARPIFPGYVGPMWDGYRLRIGKKLAYEFQATPEEKVTCEKVGCLRYETQEVYDMFSR